MEKFCGEKSCFIHLLCQNNQDIKLSVETHTNTISQLFSLQFSKRKEGGSFITTFQSILG